MESGARVNDKPVDRVHRRLDKVIGPHATKLAIKTFARKKLGVAPDEVRDRDVPELIRAIKPLLRSLLGGGAGTGDAAAVAADPAFRYQALLGGCAILVVVACALFQQFPEGRRLQLAWLVTLVSYSAAMAGGVVGALSFERGDRLRRAWLLMAAYLAIGVCKVILWGSPRHFGPAVGLLPSSQTALSNGIATTLINVLSVGGLWLFARVWHDTGVSPPWRGRITMAAFVLGMVIGGPPAWRDLQAIVSGHAGLHIGGLASDLGDILSITLAGPILVTAISMRGGLLVWPWAILTLSSIGWLLFDAVQLLPTEWVPVLDLGTIMFATLSCGAAGLAHRWAVRDTALPSIVDSW
jgi:hypothetical protein